LSSRSMHERGTATGRRCGSARTGRNYTPSLGGAGPVPGDVPPAKHTTLPRINVTDCVNDVQSALQRA